MRGYRIKHPDKIIRAYSNALNLIIYSVLRKEIEENILNNIDNVVRQFRFDDQRNDGFLDFVDNVFKKIKEKIQYKVPILTERYAREVSVFNKGEVAKTVSKSFIDYMIPDFQEAINGFVNSNTALITGLLDDTQKAIATKIANGVRNGATVGQIARSISNNIGTDRGIFSTTKTRLALIAQDQINKLNGQLTRLRQKELGITKYIWRTRLDMRVRDAHKEREGQVYRWDKEPEGGHPGMAINCRCWGEPVLNKKLSIMLNTKEKYAIS